MSRRKTSAGVCGADGRVWIEQLESRSLLSAAAALVHPALEWAPAAANGPEVGFAPALIRRAYASDAISVGAQGGYGGDGQLAVVSTFGAALPASVIPAIDRASYLGDAPWGGAAGFGYQFGYRTDLQAGVWSVPDFTSSNNASAGYAVYGSAVHVAFSEWWAVAWAGPDTQSAAPAASADQVRTIGYPGAPDGSAGPTADVQILGFAAFHEVGIAATPWAYHTSGGYDDAMGRRLPDSDTVVVVVGGESGAPAQPPVGSAQSPTSPITDPPAGVKAAAATEALRAAASSVFRAVEPPTPLALTPSSAQRFAEGPAGALQTAPVAVASAHANALAASSGALAAARRPATLAAVFFGTAPITRDAALVADGVYAATGLLPAAAAQAPDVLSAISAPQALAAHVAYNFLRLDPGTIFPDTIAAFVNEWASMPSVVTQPSVAGAWAVTAAVLGIDAVLVGVWYRRSRRARQEVRPDAHAAPQVHLERLGERWL